MRSDILIREALEKCEVLKKAGLWPNESRMRPRAWLENFDDEDRSTAAYLLSKFTYYNNDLTERLLKASYQSIGDELPKKESNSGGKLIDALESAIFVPVSGEKPNPTDSGYLFCRKARQILRIPEERIKNLNESIEHAAKGNTVIFLDDFIGSGDQFLKSWGRIHNSHSLKSLIEKNYFEAIYITLISTDYGLNEIKRNAPKVSICCPHILCKEATVNHILEKYDSTSQKVEDLLEKYYPRLKPKDDYMYTTPYLKYGYKERGLMLGFDHSIPDATLPIFWSPGDNWEPLIERT